MGIIFLVLAALLILTPGSAFATTIKINEFYAAGSTSSNPDWVEIYNDGEDFNLYQLIDAANNKKDLSLASCNGNFCTVDWYNYLNNSGDTIKLVLKTATDSSLDQVTYGSSGDLSIPGTGQSAGRNPDATGSWIISSLPTKGVPNNFPALSPSPTYTSTPTPSPTPPTSPTPASAFTISNVPSQINSDQSFNVSVNLSSADNPNTKFYLKGAFKKSGSSNYFGLTKVSGNWIKNGENFLDQYSVTTDSSGNWSGTIEVKPDVKDSGFSGTGDYIFKVGKYNSADANPSISWSNESTMKIISTESNQDDTLVNNPSPSVNSSTPPPSIKTKTTTSNKSSKSKSNDRLVYHTASVAAATASATPSTTTSTEAKVKNQKQTNPIIWVGLIFIFAGASSIGYIYLKKNAKIRF